MKFFLGAEIDDTISSNCIPEKWRSSSKKVIEKLEPFLLGQNYGSELVKLGIIPIVVSIKLESADLFKERRLFRRKHNSSDFRLRIDYDLFNRGTDEDRVHLILQNIIECVRILDSRAKKDFDGKRLEVDIRKLFNYY